MTQKLISLEEQLAAIKKSLQKQLEPKVSSFEEFNTLESLCAELAERLDNEPMHDGFEPYCGVPLAHAMISLCKQLFEFKIEHDYSPEDKAALSEILDKYLIGVTPFIHLSKAYKLNSELNSFLREIAREEHYDIPNKSCDSREESEEDEWHDEWYEDPIAWMFPDEESFLEYRERLAEMYDEESDESCDSCEEPDEDELHDEWYDDPIAWMFPDEESFWEYRERLAEMYDEESDESCDSCEEPDEDELHDEWYDDPIAWMFPDEESFLEYRGRLAEMYDEESDESCDSCEKPDEDELHDEWYDDPIAWMFPDEESFLEYRERLVEMYDEEFARQAAETQEPSQHRLLLKMDPTQRYIITPFAREFFLSKAIEYCFMSKEELYKANMIEFPLDDFSPEGRKSVEEQSNERFIELYNMIYDECYFRVGIEFINDALRRFDDEFIRRFAEHIC